MGARLLTEQAFRETMDKQNSLLEILTIDSIKTISQDWASLARIANNGVFGDIYSIGDQFVSTWKDIAANKDYEYPFQLNHVKDVELKNGEILTNRPILQAHYAHPFGVQFSHNRAFLKCPEGLTAGMYYFTIESNWNTYVKAGDIVAFTLTKDVPAGGRLSGCYGAPDTAKDKWKIYSHSADGKTILETVTPTFEAAGTNLGTQKASSRNGNLNSTQEMAYGWNRWSTSAIRQYLNSKGAANTWWTAQDEWDIAPNELTSKPGFLSGFDDDFINALKEVKLTTYTNTVNDGGEADITYDKVFLPSLAEINAKTQIEGEGEIHDYWKKKSGSATPVEWYKDNPNMITYAVENHASAQLVRLRSAYRGSACNAWFVGGSGYVNGGSSAAYSYRFSPLIVI